MHLPLHHNSRALKLYPVPALQSLHLVPLQRISISDSFPFVEASFSTCYRALLESTGQLLLKGTIAVKSKLEWYFTRLSTVFQSYHGDSSHYSCLSWLSPVLGWGSEVSCPRTFPRKKKKKPRGSSAARTQDPWLTSETLYHWAMQDRVSCEWRPARY